VPVAFTNALKCGDPGDFEKILLGGPRTLSGQQGGLAFGLECLDFSQFGVMPAPALASEDYAAELVELYWASLLRDVPFTQYASDPVAVNAATELSSLASYKGSPDNTTDCAGIPNAAPQSIALEPCTQRKAGCTSSGCGAPRS